ncbi:mucin-19-like [Anastrepha obliqua]|uniref:mucin-19-like n=1 Tax=Anastrepha obliqua TaxID=95512 RepID=UPI00240A2EBF|nr:mucin-19-like [Anastrepha obliqua]
MRTFLVLCSLISATYAGSLGYNYGPAIDGGLGGLSGGLSAGPSYGGIAPSGPSYGGVGAAGPSYGGVGAAGPSYGGLGAAGPSYGGVGAAGPSYGGVGAAGPSYGGVGAAGLSYGGPAAAGPSYSGPVASGPSHSAPAEVNKEFFSYTAPEHEFNDVGDSGPLANSLKKNVRVVFIKGPENTGLENAAVQLAKSVGEDRTAIYVLSKQADIGDLANKLQSLNRQTSNKPEVHFVKYKTPADADNAQRAIQSQYDGLSGPSSSQNGGVAPVLDFASKGPASAGPAAQQYGGAPVGGVENTYLPPNKRV